MFLLKKIEVENFFEKIKKNIGRNKFKNFFNYFKRTWFSKTIPLPLWNYSDLIEDEENSLSY